MYLVGKITVTSVLPEELSRLRDIAYNLWWSWNSEAADLFSEIDPPLWEKFGKNPVRFLQEVSHKRLYEKMDDSLYMKRYHDVVSRFDTYMSGNDTWFNQSYPDKKEQVIAYFSAEFGLNEVLPVYSGGLGVLSGDHLKSASDLGLPFVSVGLFYKQGYFNQHINHEGWQETDYPKLNTSQLPVRTANDKDGNPVQIGIQLPGRVVYAKVWQVSVGRVPLYLMDTDIEQNNPVDRTITARLYGGDQEIRIQQEIFLGVGGVRALETLGIKPSVYHMNEGHSAFLGLEHIRKLVQEEGLSFKAAKEAASSSIIFTTHTPVPAGNDVFPLQMIDRYFGNFWNQLKISRHEFLDLGLKVNGNQNFNMTVLALSLAGWKNGVSKLHGAVTRNIFNDLWPCIPEEEVPITHVTNGIHTLTWLAPGFKHIYDRYLDKNWNKILFKKDIWENIDNIPDEELWEIHCALKKKMINLIRSCLKKQRTTNGEPPETVKETDELLDPQALTIGFARRFATYKRANLIFRDIERIKRIFNDPAMPVQIIFAGKAHPADRPAHEIIKNIHKIANSHDFKGKVILVENYNMTLARSMVQGADLWLNNPRRPLEASGTSGQKVAINGVLNFSVLDGWWCEGYNGKNGWTIGDDTFYENEHNQDNADSDSIYQTLENKIIPLFYDRNEKGIPVEWVKMMKESIKSLSHQYSTHRMVQEYTSKMYAKSMERAAKVRSSHLAFAVNLSNWKEHIEKNWPQVQIMADKSIDRLKELSSVSGEHIPVSVFVSLGNIDPSDIKVEICYGVIGKNNLLKNPQCKEMTIAEKTSPSTYRYSTDIMIEDGGEYGYTFRIIPGNPDLIDKFDMALVCWAVQ